MNPFRSAALAILLAAGCAGPAPDPAPDGRLNVLMIAVDDLRPQLGCYGDPTVKSPRIDGLAARSVTFSRAYCQQALCSPSRISLLSGRYPSTSRIFEIGPTLRSAMPDITTLPQHFKNQGYVARSLGKVYHVGIDDPESWSVPSWHSKKPRYGPDGSARVKAAAEALRREGKTAPAKGPGVPFYAGPAFESPDVADDDLLDGDTAREGVAALREMSTRPDQPFFLSVGFANPHVPWVAPRRYWDLYRSAELPMAAFPHPPKAAPEYAAKTGADFTWYGNVPKQTPYPEEFRRDCLHGYLAAISYVDAQVGRLLDALDETGLSKNTVVILWGDHGYYMGEHGWWGGKHNNYEGATRAPLLVAVPGTSARGVVSSSLVEFVDIAPTLIEVCGLPSLKGLEGRSFRALLKDPAAPFREATLSWYPKGGRLGNALRTERWRYVEWISKSGHVDDVELYDERDDPLEHENLAGRPEHAALIASMAERLQHAGHRVRPD